MILLSIIAVSPAVLPLAALVWSAGDYIDRAVCAALDRFLPLE